MNSPRSPASYDAAESPSSVVTSSVLAVISGIGAIPVNDTDSVRSQFAPLLDAVTVYVPVTASSSSSVYCKLTFPCGSVLCGCNSNCPFGPIILITVLSIEPPTSCASIFTVSPTS